MDLSLFWSRILRSALLSSHLYEEVEADNDALGQAALVVVLSSLAAGIGGVTAGPSGTFMIIVAALLSWYVWAVLTYLIGTRMLAEPQTRADLGEMLRTIGFASSPGLIRIFGVVPGFTVLVNLIAGLWMLVAMVIAVRQALDYESTWRAIGVCAIGWLVQTLILIVVFAVFGVGNPA